MNDAMMTRMSRPRSGRRGFKNKEEVVGREAWEGKEMKITVGRVIRARGKMMKNKANGPSDCLAREMVFMESVYESLWSPTS